MSKWKECKLGDVVNTNLNSISLNYPYSNILYLDTGSITSGKIESYQTLALNDAPSRAKRLVKDGDIVYSTVRPIQRHYGFIKSPPPNLVVSTGFCVIETVKELADPMFIYNLLASNDVVELLDTIAEGSTSAYPSLKPSDIENLDILLPPLPEQKAIASVLCGLDDKIDLLHRQNETLEAMAEALFRQWFVEDAKDDWEKVKLGDILETIETGSRPKGGIDPNLRDGIPSIGAESINGIGIYDFSKTKYIPREFFENMRRGVMKSYDVLIYKDGAYVGRKGMFGNGFPFTECVINEHIFILRTNAKASQIFLYFLLQEYDLAQLNSNSAQPGLNQQAMNLFEVVLPPEKVIKRFEQLTKQLIDKLFFNAQQIHTLEKLHNTLLPKLMSGEVRVIA